VQIANAERSGAGFLNREGNGGNEGGRTQNGVMEYWSDGRTTESPERKIPKETKITEKVPGADEIPSPGTRDKKILLGFTLIYLDLVGFGWIYLDYVVPRASVRSGWFFACARQMQICANLCKFTQTVQKLFPNLL
jgi:hypothetical protein